MIKLSANEQAVVYATLVPGFRPGKRRYNTEYRGGDSYGLSIDLERGRFADFALNEKGDCLDFVMLARGCNFRAAVEYVERILGRSLRDSRPAYLRQSAEMLARAEMFRTGLLWRIGRALETVKRDLFGPQHKPAARATRQLTEHERWVKSWSVYTATEMMRRMRRKLVCECIAEVQELHDRLARAIPHTEWEHAA